MRAKYSRLLVTMDVIVALLATMMMAIGILEVSFFNIYSIPLEYALQFNT
jgi:hypothetical protein